MRAGQLNKNSPLGAICVPFSVLYLTGNAFNHSDASCADRYCTQVPNFGKSLTVRGWVIDDLTTFPRLYIFLGAILSVLFSESGSDRDQRIDIGPAPMLVNCFTVPMYWFISKLYSVSEATIVENRKIGERWAKRISRFNNFSCYTYDPINHILLSDGAPIGSLGDHSLDSNGRPKNNETQSHEIGPVNLRGKSLWCRKAEDSDLML